MGLQQKSKNFKILTKDVYPRCLLDVLSIIFSIRESVGGRFSVFLGGIGEGLVW